MLSTGRRFEGAGASGRAALERRMDCVDVGLQRTVAQGRSGAVDAAARETMLLRPLFQARIAAPERDSRRGPAPGKRTVRSLADVPWTWLAGAGERFSTSSSFLPPSLLHSSSLRRQQDGVQLTDCGGV